MNKTLLLFKTIYRNSTAHSDGENGKKKMRSSVVALLSVSPLLILVAVFLSFLASTLERIEDIAVFVNAIMFATQMLVLFLSMANIFSVLYNAKDTAFLQTLPVKAASIFWAKFALIYVNALKLSAVVFLPLAYSVTITFNVVTGAMFYGAYVFLLFAWLALPILPLFLVVLFSLPIAYVGSFFKGKQTLKSVFVILFYLVLMCAYLVVVFFMETADFEGDGLSLSAGVINSLYTLSNVLYPDKVLLQFCYGVEIGKNLGIFAAIAVAAIGITLLLASLFYKRINTHKSQQAAADVNKNAVIKQNNVVVALAKRDFVTISRNSSLAMSSFANLILAPIFIVLMYFITFAKSADGDEMTPIMSEMMSIGFVIMYSMIFLGGANVLAAQAYTREGKSFFSSKALPIKPIDSIKSKLLLAIAVPSVIMIPIALISLLLYKIDVLSTLFIVIDTMLVVIGVSAFNILFDMKKGNQHWEDPSELREATKGNYYQAIGAFIAIMPSVILFVGGMLLSAFAEYLGVVVIKIIYWSVATAMSATICLIGVSLLKTRGLEYYALIGKNKPETKLKTRKFDKRLMK